MKFVKIIAALAVLLLGVGAVVVLSPAPSAAVTPGEVVHSYGIIRKSGATWEIIGDLHKPSGLATVTCEAGGTLRVDMTPLAAVGTASVIVDETYAGVVVVGASVGLDLVRIWIKTPTGVFTPCSSSALNLAGSNVFLDVWGLA